MKIHITSNFTQILNKPSRGRLKLAEHSGKKITIKMLLWIIQCLYGGMCIYMLICMGTCMACVCIYENVHVCWNQRTVGASLVHSPSYELRHRVSFVLINSLGRQLTLWILYLCLLWTGDTGEVHRCCVS